MLLIIGVLFGILGGVIAYVNAYEGYSHFPGISRRKKVIISLKIAIGAFFMSVAGCAVAFFFFRT